MSQIKRIIIALALAILFCQFSYYFIRKGIDKYQYHNKERLTELLLNKTNYDLIFIGSSRTHLSINPRIIDSICGINSYNAGMDGGNLFEFNMILKAYLQNHPPPKFLVLTIDLFSFKPNASIFNYSQYLSFTKNKVIETYLNEAGHHTSQLKIFPFLEMTDYDDNTKGYFIKGLLGLSGIEKEDFTYKGYVSNGSGYINPEGKKNERGYMAIDETCKKYLAEMMQICKQNNIKVILTYAPEYNQTNIHQTINSKDIFDIVNRVATENNAPYFREDSLSLCKDPHFFATIGHLNRKGADIYSVSLAEQIKNYIKTNN